MVEALSPNDAESSYVSLVRGQHADGLVLSGPRTDDPAFVDLVRDGFPVVLQGSLPEIPVPSVDVDNVAGARQAVDHLIGLGHRRIAMITNAPVVYTAAVQRAEGYRQALAAADIPYDAGLVDEGEFDAPSGHRAMVAILRRRSFDAVFVASDVVALGAIGALRESGRRVPDDVSVIGFDDVPLAGFFDPPLTTVRLPAFDLGQAAGEALIRRIADPSVVDRTLLPTELIVRASTKARDPR
jgi:DNA-binding LacI/PurR family transcriptional regulator